MRHISFVGNQLETFDSLLITNDILERLGSILLNPKNCPFTAITTVNNSGP